MLPTYRLSDPVKRFWSKVDKQGPFVIASRCWVWVSGKYSKTGYGQFSFGGRVSGGVLSHRHSMVLYLGRPLKQNEHVLHRCDNRICVRPSHLFIGTEKDNKKDMVRKGRSAKGEQIKQSKLTSKDVQEIKNCFYPGMGPLLARKYGVHHCTVYRIVKGLQWKHVR